MPVDLRPVDPADLQIFFDHQSDPAACRMAAFTSKDPTDRAEFDAHWERIRADPRITIRTILFDGAAAGWVLSYPGLGDLEVSYWIGRPFWGRGVATAALRRFLESEPRRPVHGRAAADNTGSIRVLEKCGFVRVGEERGYANARGEEIVEVVMVLG